MELSELVEAVLSGDLLTARQWVSDARRAKLDWPNVTRPRDLSADALSIAAGLAEMLAARAQMQSPAWTADIEVLQTERVLDPGLERMPRSFAFAKEHGPVQLRRRKLIALPDFLDVA